MSRSCLQARRVASSSCSRSCSRSGCASCASAGSTVFSSSRKMIVASRAASVAAAARLTRRRSRCVEEIVATSSSSERKRRPAVRTSCKRFSFGFENKPAAGALQRAPLAPDGFHEPLHSNGPIICGRFDGGISADLCEEEFRREIDALSRPRRAVGHRCRGHWYYHSQRASRNGETIAVYYTKLDGTSLGDVARFPSTATTRRKRGRASAQRGTLRRGGGGCRTAERDRSDSVPAGNPRLERGRQRFDGYGRSLKGSRTASRRIVRRKRRVQSARLYRDRDSRHRCGAGTRQRRSAGDAARGTS